MKGLFSKVPLTVVLGSSRHLPKPRGRVTGAAVPTPPLIASARSVRPLPFTAVARPGTAHAGESRAALCASCVAGGGRRARGARVELANVGVVPGDEVEELRVAVLDRRHVHAVRKPLRTPRTSTSHRARSGGETFNACSRGGPERIQEPGKIQCKDRVCRREQDRHGKHLHRLSNAGRVVSSELQFSKLLCCCESELPRHNMVALRLLDVPMRSRILKNVS